MRRTATTLAPAMLVLGGCTQGGLQPRGGDAHRIYVVLLALVVAAAVVSLVVVGLWATGSLRRRGHDPEERRADHDDEDRLQRWFVVGGGIVMPAVVLAVFFGVQIASTTAQPQDGELTIEVVGHQYWWEVTYPDVGGVGAFETANVLHVPTGTPVRVVMRSDDVIHSLWVPQLAGKTDLVPGRVTEFVMDADEPGTYPGYCAEYCGLQHTWMKFSVVAMEPDAFRSWAEQQAGAATEPDAELATRGREVFEEQSCVGCHTIRGVSDEGQVGPDLTHLASRPRIGAGILPLDEDNLRAWTVNAQTIKPGAQMPPQELTEEELDALVAYLLTLE